MLDEERIRHMIKLASYEAEKGREEIKISRYYRSDYLGLALIRNFFSVSIAYFLIVAVIVGYETEYLLDNIHRMDLVSLAVWLIAGYVAIIVLYSVITYIYYSVKYAKAKKNVRGYYSELNKLTKMYEKQDERGNRKKNSGRRVS
ncbi:MAG: hypothetical protein ACOYBL_10480 [Lachnospiraceae bacterium]|jgi:hypothetical protein